MFLFFWLKYKSMKTFFIPLTGELRLPKSGDFQLRKIGDSKLLITEEDGRLGKNTFS